MRLPEGIQERVNDYYEQKRKSLFILGDESLTMLAPTLIEQINSHNIQEILSKNPIFACDEDDRNAMIIAQAFKNSLYIPGDVLIKQHDFDKDVFVVLSGAVEVVREHKEMPYEEFR